MNVEIGLGGGCHWCTEAIFQHLKGVSSVEQGFVASTAPYDSFSEAVRLYFNSEEISLETLVKIHLRTHASTYYHKMSKKYRSAVYVLDDAQSEEATEIIRKISKDFDRPIITKVLKLVQFRFNQLNYLNYYLSKPVAPFCESNIDPKLALIRRDFAEVVLDDQAKEK